MDSGSRRSVTTTVLRAASEVLGAVAVEVLALADRVGLVHDDDREDEDDYAE